jgi:hypothetical protein
MVGKSEPAPTKHNTMDEWHVNMTLFFHWVVVPNLKAEGCKTVLRVFLNGVHPTGWMIPMWECPFCCIPIP